VTAQLACEGEERSSSRENGLRFGVTVQEDRGEAPALGAVANRGRSCENDSAWRSSGLGHTVDGLGPASLLPFIQKFFQSSNQFKLAKYANDTSGTPKVSKLCILEDKFKRTTLLLGRSSNS
jgi:hypothetical protein